MHYYYYYYYYHDDDETNSTAALYLSVCWGGAHSALCTQRVDAGEIVGAQGMETPRYSSCVLIGLGSPRQRRVATFNMRKSLRDAAARAAEASTVGYPVSAWN